MAEENLSERNAQFDTSKGIISWFARNSVAANLLMLSIIVIGAISAFTIRKQMFPQIESTQLTVSIVYPGAAPREVEESITIKLEEALHSIQGLERIITRSNRGVSIATLEVLESYDAQEVLDEVKSAVDSISSFPEGIERPIVRQNKYRQEVMYVSLFGDISNHQLKAFGERIYDEIRNLPDINISDYYSGSNYEISIEISQEKMRQYNLSFEEVAGAVRSFSTNRSAGQIRADNGFISVRVDEQAYVGREFEQLPLRTLADGSSLRLGDVAQVRDGFEEGIRYSKINGKNTVTFFVGATKEQSITELSDIVNEYIETRQKTLPEGLYLESWVDFTYYLEGRLNMMLSNMVYGGILVFLLLSLFLHVRLAFWVMMGLPICFFGALAFLPLSWIDVTINVGSLFAFIMVLGVVVDDAIVIGESVHTEVQQHGSTIDNVIRGAQRVATPATFGVLTTMAAFAPMAMESGPTAAFPNAIGFVVVLCLCFSLVESKLILPAHLARMKFVEDKPKGFRHRFDSRLKSFIDNKYLPFLQKALTFRYSVLAAFIAVIIFTAALFSGGVIKFVGTPKIPHDFSTIRLQMNNTATEEDTLAAVLKVEKMVREVDASLQKEFGLTAINNIYTELNGRTSGEIQIKLVDPEVRPVNTFELSARWREVMPEIIGIKRLTIIDSLFQGGQNDGDVAFLVKSQNESQLAEVAEVVKAELKKIEGVYEVNDSEADKAIEVKFDLKPVAKGLGLTTSDVAAQTSYSLYGLEAQRIVRDRQEIKVMLRYPEEERNTIESIRNISLRTPDGSEVPLSEVAEIYLTEGIDEIYREDGSRAITIWGSVDLEKTQALVVAKHLREKVFPDLLRRNSSVTIEETGKLKDEREDLDTQLRNIILILIPIYILLALPLRSYLQPIIIMSVIPFGIIGAVLGHVILGIDMSQLSIFGIFAAIGVVVNDSLVFVDYVNKARERGEALRDAVLHAGQRRFRAIILTSLTTFFGLIPIILETSLQAQIVIPMAVSLAFGVLFATVVTLVLVPTLYVVGNDFARGIQSLSRRMFGQWQSDGV